MTDLLRRVWEEVISSYRGLFYRHREALRGKIQNVVKYHRCMNGLGAETRERNIRNKGSEFESSHCRQRTNFLL